MLAVAATATVTRRILILILARGQIEDVVPNLLMIETRIRLPMVPTVVVAAEK
jgi:hypothetical protein